MFKTRIALFGLGMHAQRIYYPLFKDYAEKLNIELSLVVDLESSKEPITNFINSQNYFPKNLIFLPDNDTYGTYELPTENYESLSSTLKHLDIDGAIISTQPLAHKAYAMFCMDQNVNILMDKPITTEAHAVSKLSSARKIYDDYQALKVSYQKAKILNPELLFSVVAQRRYHPAYSKIKKLVDEVSQRVNIPITSIHSYHSDGEWRMPFEIADQSYHSYNEGFGKLSHSGYHSIDILLWLVLSSYNNCKQKMFNEISLNSTLVMPDDLLYQFTEDDYRNVFCSGEYDQKNPYLNRDQDFQKIIKKCGEVDAFVRMNFKHESGAILTTATMNLQHNGFSNRSWLSNNGRNLYKGNGRVRHESHIIQQGPFQSIHLHAYQSKFDPDESDEIRFKVGGVDHLDVLIFRNPLVTTDEVREFAQFSVEDFGLSYMKGYSHGHQEDSRAMAFFEFINYIGNNRQSKSDILTHELSVGVFSGIYQSHCLQKEITLHRSFDKIEFSPEK